MLSQRALLRFPLSLDQRDRRCTFWGHMVGSVSACWATSGQRGAAETYTQSLTRLRIAVADLRRDQSLSNEWRAALADRIDAIETELEQRNLSRWLQVGHATAGGVKRRISAHRIKGAGLQTKR